jgi:hypothetical protein
MLENKCVFTHLKEYSFGLVRTLRYESGVLLGVSCFFHRVVYSFVFLSFLLLHFYDISPRIITDWINNHQEEKDQGMKPLTKNIGFWIQLLNVWKDPLIANESFRFVET